ncbi:type III secretion system inner membrane ring lipoprotein SctJ [Candidatus Ichthyocystis hellenicum]|uniref:type III secretion system inner membrane ring lipoprotein SctJ n=1 Tax=Candidatus Ichthyocystis hellenicum TaxID=1561003 RepID=UPI000B8A174A|nr:type III secretion inner membrane ring lipoprotein SctJ [Candidatus Ichthyocystis hellenicum]
MSDFCLCTFNRKGDVYSRALWLKFRLFFIALLCVFLAGCGENVEVVSNIPENDANEVLSALLSSGIEATKTLNKDGLATVFINSSRVSEAIDILRSRGLPRTDYRGLGDVFKKDGMISSPLEEKARFLFALSEELAKTISHIDGVVFSRVHLVLPDHDPFTDVSIASSSAVFIKYQKEYNIDILIPQIKKLVARSIPGLTEDRVSIVLVPAEDNAKSTVMRQSPNLNGEEEDNSSSSVGGYVTFVILGVFITIILLLTVGYYLLWTKKISLPINIPGLRAGKSEKSKT